MEIALSYYPLLHTAPINRCGLVLLKPSGHRTQKFAFIGSDGLLKCYRIDKNQLSKRFESTLPTGNPECAIGDKDSIIYSQKKTIIYANRKGETTEIKNSALDNNITSMMIHNGKMHVASGTMCYTVGVQESNIIFDSPIIGFAALGNVTYIGIASGAVFSFVPGSQQLLHTLPGHCTTISTIQRSSNESYLAVGCSDNKLRFFNNLDKEVSSIDLPSPPTCVSEFDVDKDGFPELFVALENGNVYLVSLSIIETPKILKTINVGFAATNIKAGYIYSANLVSALVTSQSGHVGIVSAETRKDRSLLTSIAPKVTEQELKELNEQVKNLERAAKANSSRPAAITAQTKIELRGDPVTESFALIIESERPISRVSFSTNIQVNIKSRSDSQTMIFQTKRKPPTSSGVVKPVDPNSTRIAVDLLYEVGIGGDLQVFVNYANSSAVFSKDFQLKPFGLLKKLQTNPLAGIKDDSLSLITISTSGTSAIFHDIINNCLPYPIEEGTSTSFSSGCISAPLTVFLSGDKFVARSVFFPIVVQLRSYILSSMNAKKQGVSFDTVIGPNCLNEFFRQIAERFFYVNKAAAEYMRLVALREVRNTTSMHSSVSDISNDESLRIMQEAEEIERRYEECENEYKSYVAVIESFYVEMWKLSNINATSCIDELRIILKETIDQESLNSLIDFMQAQPEKRKI